MGPSEHPHDSPGAATGRSAISAAHSNADPRAWGPFAGAAPRVAAERVRQWFRATGAWVDGSTRRNNAFAGVLTLLLALPIVVALLVLGALLIAGVLALALVGGVVGGVARAIDRLRRRRRDHRDDAGRVNVRVIRR